MKTYDREYFDHWYRDPRHAVVTPLVLARKVALVLSLAEYHFGRAVESVLDVGCGEGAWQPVLRKLRPRAYYLGLDSSEYAIARYGRSRNLGLARFAQLAEQRFDRSFDLLVCSDVIHYLPTAELVRGLAGFGELCHGVAFLELFCRDDEFVGDQEGFVPRTAAWYRRTFARAGFTHAGSHCYLARRLREAASALELAAPP